MAALSLVAMRRNYGAPGGPVVAARTKPVVPAWAPIGWSATQAPQLIHAGTMGAQSMAPTPTTSASTVIGASP
jgi:hypothetical protein